MEHLEFLTLSFILANLVSEGLKFLLVKILTKIDHEHDSWLDVDYTLEEE